MAVAEPGSIAEIAAAVGSGRISATSIVEQSIARCERSQEALNAFTFIDREGALEAAAGIDRRIEAGETPGPLAGVPIAVKDLFDQAGKPNTHGSSAPPVVPAATAECIRRLEAAGAVVVARAGLHEYAFGFSSENHWHGPVRNPWDLSLSPGGSSGGSGSAVSAGLVAAALGTDTGGSVRVPAALCGVVGLKVTHGRVSLRGVFPLAPMLDTVGPIGRSVGDVAAVYDAIAGDDPADPWSVPRPVEAVAGAVGTAGLKIGVPLPWARLPTDADEAEGFERWLEGAAAAGADVVEIEAGGLEPSQHSTDGLYFEVARMHGDYFRQHRAQFGPEVAERLAATLEATPEGFFDALRWRRATRSAAERALGTVDVLATPTVAALHKTIGRPTIRLGGEDVPYTMAMARFTTPVNHIGLPALALPLPGRGVPPASLQLIGPAWSEARLLGIGLGMEEAGLVATRRPPHWRPGGIDPDPARSA